MNSAPDGISGPDETESTKARYQADVTGMRDDVVIARPGHCHAIVDSAGADVVTDSLIDSNEMTRWGVYSWQTPHRVMRSY